MFATDIMKKVSAPPKIRIQIDLPDIAPDSRVYFYGYHVELEWLSDFYTAHRRLDPEDKSYDTLSKASAAIQVFRRQSGIKRLEYEMVLKDPLRRRFNSRTSTWRRTCAHCSNFQ